LHSVEELPKYLAFLCETKYNGKAPLCIIGVHTNG
jgi:hypothetical protein